jgi:D-arabinose 1-dehydrogenase-like Zn-dependent alcohol dehydrogenase
MEFPVTPGHEIGGTIDRIGSAVPPAARTGHRPSRTRHRHRNLGAAESVRLAFALLTAKGAVASVGLVGNRIDVPLFPFVGCEFSYFGSFWGNYNDLTEVIALAEAGQIKDSVTQVRFEDVNDHIEALGRGDFVGRAVTILLSRSVKNHGTPSRATPSAWKTTITVSPSA